MLPVKLFVTTGTTADCSQAEALIDGLPAQHVLADKAYDTNALLKHLTERNMNPVIPPNRRRKTLRAYDRDLYRHRHLIENAFLKLKQWSAVATRYAKQPLHSLPNVRSLQLCYGCVNSGTAFSLCPIIFFTDIMNFRI